MCSFQKYTKRSGFYSSEFCRCLHFLADPVCGCDPQIFLRGSEWRICGDRELQDDICKQSVSSGSRQHTSVLRSVCAAAVSTAPRRSFNSFCPISDPVTEKNTGNIATSARSTRSSLPIFLIRNICITFLILPRLSPRLSTIPGSAERSPVRSPLPQPTSYPATGPYTSC